MRASAVLLLVLAFGISTAEHRNEQNDSESTLTQLARLQPQENDTDTCPTWFLPVTDQGNDTCKCGNDLYGIVRCYNVTQPVYLDRHYCMSYNQDKSALVVGNCFYSNGQPTLRKSPYFSLPSNASKLEHRLCQEYHREGQLCGRCKSNFTIAVYSYTMSCVQCSDYGYNWAKYLAVAFLPLTVFCVIVIVFRVSATSGSMNAFILVSQIISTPSALRTLNIYCHNKYSTSQCYAIYTINSVYGIWNIDFFRIKYNLLIPALLYDIYGKNIGTTYLFYDATIEYFGKEHLPYATVAIILLLVFVVSPCLLLCLFPCRCFQRFLNHCALRSLALTTFMDVFQGCYKDGTNGTRDCRCFAAMYFILLSVFLGSGAIIQSYSIFPALLSILTIFIMITAIVRPYKSPAHNIINIFWMLVLALSATSFLEILVPGVKKFPFKRLPTIMVAITLLIPPAYGLALLLYNLLAHRRVVQQAFTKLQCLLPNCCRRLAHADSEDSLPDRMAHPEQYAALLAEPVREEESSEEESLPTDTDFY